jgi:hypothetical protein
MKYFFDMFKFFSKFWRDCANCSLYRIKSSFSCWVCLANNSLLCACFSQLALSIDNFFTCSLNTWILTFVEAPILSKFDDVCCCWVNCWFKWMFSSVRRFNCNSSVWIRSCCWGWFTCVGSSLSEHLGQMNVSNYSRFVSATAACKQFIQSVCEHAVIVYWYLYIQSKQDVVDWSIRWGILFYW